MKLWVDDERKAPPEYDARAVNSASAIGALAESKRRGLTVELMSLDHDLGWDDTTRPIVMWMIENDYWPKTVLVHTANPVGREWLMGMILRYKP